MLLQPATRRVLVLLLACAPCLAQKREPMRGSAVDVLGKPWADATVVLLSRPLSEDDRFGEADEQTARTDGKGRFQVSLLPGRRYVAWASAELPDGNYVASHPVGDVRAGLPLELVADAPRPHATVRVDGLDPWRAHGAITCTLVSHTEMVILQPCPEREGKVTLPAFPGRRAALEVRCGERVLLPWPQALQLNTAEEQHVKVHPPRAVRFQCVDKARQPMAGVAFCVTSWTGRFACTEIARSDALGMVTPLLPIPAGKYSWVNYPAMLLAPGSAPRSWIGKLEIRDGYEAAKGDPLAVFVMQNGPQLARKLTNGDSPVLQATIRVSCVVQSAEGSATHQETFCIPVRAGSFLAEVGQRHGCNVSAFLPQATVATLQPENGFPLHPELLLEVVDDSAAVKAQPESIDLQQLAALDLQVLGPDGAPADSAMVGIASARGFWQRIMTASTDRIGRVRLLLPRDRKLHLACWSEHGSEVVEIDTGKLTGPLRPRLQACQQLQGKVLDGKGGPAAFADVHIASDCDLGNPMGAIATCCWHRCRTDAQGRFTMPLYPRLRYTVQRVSTPDDDHYPQLEKFTAEQPPEELVIDLAVRR